MNKLENTPANKARFFAQYWGVNDWNLAVVRHPHEEEFSWYVDGEDINHIKYLNLIPLSLISDEDAIEALSYMKMGGGYGYDTLLDYCNKNKYSDDQKVNYFKANLPYYKDSYLLCMFLISKGYYIGDGSEVSFGWVKLREV